MEIILTEEEIANENFRMHLEDETLIILNQYPKRINRKNLIEIISKDTIPSSQCTKEILENRNLKNIPEDIIVESGITIKRTTLKYLPTNDAFFISPIVEENIATVLPFATPLLILHQSLDKKWYYIQCSFYRGWILKDNILIISEQDRLLFEKPNKYIVITSPLLPFHDTYLDLGSKFPVLGIHDHFYEIFIPTNDGIIIDTIRKDNCHLGYLPYTKENILSLAYKCINIPYKWGGYDNGLDCSLFIYTLFKTFGFEFPRDTKNQEKVIGLKKIDLKGKTEIEKKEILNTISYPAILHKKGHILLAISSTKVIHSYGDAGKIIISTLECYGTNLYPLLTSVSYLYK